MDYVKTLDKLPFLAFTSFLLNSAGLRQTAVSSNALHRGIG